MCQRLVSTILVMVVLGLSSAAFATDIVASGRTVRGAPGQNNKQYGEPFTLQKEGTLTAIVSENGAAGFIIISYTNPANAVYWTVSSTAGIGRKFSAGSYVIYPYLRDDSNDATISVRFTY